MVGSMFGSVLLLLCCIAAVVVCNVVKAADYNVAHYHVAGPDAKYQKLCRGWPLLEKYYGVRPRAVNPVTACSSSEEELACGFTIVDEARTGRLGNVLVRVELFVKGRFRDGLDAVRVDNDTLIVQWRPPNGANVEGAVQIKPRLHYYYASSSDFDGTYLGGMEPRCQKCKATVPRMDPKCDALALVPLAPTFFTVKRSSDVAVSDSRGYWVGFNPLTGRSFGDKQQGDARLLLPPNFDTTPSEALEYVGTMHLDAPAALSCLERRGVSRVSFLGDSVVRALYEAFTRRLGTPIDIKALEAARFDLTAHENHQYNRTLIEAAQFASRVDTNGVRVKFAQIWGLADLYLLGLLQQKYVDDPRFAKVVPERAFDVGAVFGDDPKASSSNNEEPSNEAVLVYNGGSLHMPSSAIRGTFARNTLSLVRVLERHFASSETSLLLILVTPPALLGMRNPGYSTRQFQSFLKVANDLATSVNAKKRRLRVEVLDLEPLTLARWDATSDGVHFDSTVNQMAVSQIFNLLCKEEAPR